MTCSSLSHPPKVSHRGDVVWSEQVFLHDDVFPYLWMPADTKDRTSHRRERAVTVVADNRDESRDYSHHKVTDYHHHFCDDKCDNEHLQQISPTECMRQDRPVKQVQKYEIRDPNEDMQGNTP